MKKKTIFRGDIYYCDLSPAIGSEQSGLRPCVVIQNNMGNLYSRTVIVAPLTTKIKPFITHVSLAMDKDGVEKEGQVLLEHIRTIDKSRLRNYLGSVSAETMVHINRAIKISLGVD